MVTLKEARRRLNKDELGNYPDMRNNADTLFKELNLKILTDEQFLELGDKVLSVTSHNDRRRWSKKDYRRNHYIEVPALIEASQLLKQMYVSIEKQRKRFVIAKQHFRFLK